MRRRPSGDAGFTLLEVIVALAILSVAVVAAIQSFTQSLRLLRLAGEHQYATQLADQKAREVVTPTEGREEGQDEGDHGTYAWERVTSIVPTPTLADQATAKDWRMFRIDVHVRWAGREVEVATLRTTPATIDPKGVLPSKTQMSPPTRITR
jgi:type II secretion system protein I